MKIAAPFEATKISQTKSGDLIRIGHSMSPFGLIIHDEGDKRVVGVLHDNRSVPPYHIVFQRDFACFRYAEGWVLDLPRDEAEFDTSAYSGTPGAVHIGGNGPVMNFGPHDIMENGLTVNLNSFEWDDVNAGDVAFPNWRIWASEADMHREKASPIFFFKAPKG